MRTRNEPINQEDIDHLTQIRQQLNQMLVDAGFYNKHVEFEVEDLLATALNEIDELLEN